MTAESITLTSTSSRDEILSRMQPLLQVLGAPAELPQLYLVLSRFEPVLDQLTLIADDQSRPGLERLSSLIAELVQKKGDVLAVIPEVGGDRARFHGYMKSNPVYCIFGAQVLDPEILPQREAMLSSAFPALVRLQQKMREDCENYESTAYQVGLAFRFLAQPNAMEKELLLELPNTAMGHQEYLDQLDKAAEALEVKLTINSEYNLFYWVRRLLQGMDRDSWVREENTKGGRVPPSRGPRRKLAERDGVVSYERMPDRAKDTGESGLRVVDYFRRPSRKEVIAEKFDPGLQADAKPDESTLLLRPGKVLQYHYQQRREQVAQNSRYAAQAIELENQALPITLATLSRFEVACFLIAIRRLRGPEWSELPGPDRALVAVWAGCRFFFSRPAEALEDMRVATDANDTALPCWNAKTGTVSLSTLPPKHKAPPAGSNTIDVGERIVLEVPRILSAVLKRLKKPKDRLFGKRHEELEKHFGTLLNAINRGRKTALSPARLQRVIAERMNLLAPADGVIGCYFRGQPPNGHIPAVYSAVPVARIQQLYVQAWSAFDRRAASVYSEIDEPQLPGLIQLDAQFVGSRHVPRTEFVKDTIADLIDRIRKLSKVPGPGVIELHNMYTVYVSLFLLVTSGMRSLSTVLPGSVDVDWKTGFCLASDKDNSRYTEARLVYLLPMVLKQLSCYREHIQRMRKYLALWNPKVLDQLDFVFASNDFSTHNAPQRDKDLAALQNGAPLVFMLSSRGAQVLPVRESQLREALGEDWDLRVGAIRHFVRTQLLWAGCAGEAIDALLGHWTRGAEPWGKFSTLPPAQWRQQIEDALHPLVEQLGLCILPSPLERQLS